MQNNIEYYAMQCNAIQIIMKNYAWEIIGNYVSMQLCIQLICIIMEIMYPVFSTSKNISTTYIQVSLQYTVYTKALLNPIVHHYYCYYITLFYHDSLSEEHLFFKGP
jgi:hypothetical protein